MNVANFFVKEFPGDSSHSAVEDIRKTIRYYSDFDKPLLPGELGLDRLGTSVWKLLLSYREGF